MRVPAAVFLASALAGVASPVAAEAPPTAVLTVRVGKLRSDEGQVGCMLFATAKGFPTDPSAALQKVWCPISGGVSVCTFAPQPEGVYAVACFHDENGNGKLDTGTFGIPTEGTVVSNHAKGILGPPSFNDAKFAFPATPTLLALRMGY